MAMLVITRGYPFQVIIPRFHQGAAERPSGKHVRAGRFISALAYKN